MYDRYLLTLCYDRIWVRNHKKVDSNIEEYTTRFHELVRLCPHMVTPALKHIELYVGGLVPQIQGMITSSKPATIQQAIRLAHQLTDQAVLQGTLPKRAKDTRTSDPTHKRKWDNNSSNNHNNHTGKSFTPNQSSQQQQRKFDNSKNSNSSASTTQSSGG